MPATLRDFKADLFRALASPVRIRVLEELRAAGSLTVSELAQRAEVEPSNLSQHLAILRSRSVVAAEREGTSVRYSVPDQAVFAILDGARALFETQFAWQHELLSDAEGA